MTVLAPLAKLDIGRDCLQPFGFGGLSMWGKYLLNRFNRQLESHCYHQLGRGTLTQTPAVYSRRCRLYLPLVRIRSLSRPVLLP